MAGVEEVGCYGEVVGGCLPMASDQLLLSLYQHCRENVYITLV